MDNWKLLKVDGVPNIRKCVAEFEVQELEKTPYGKFKIKIFEDSKGNLTGYTNLQAKDSDGCPIAGVGYGSTIEEALEDTIKYFLKMLEDKKDLTEEDFECSDSFDF